LRLTAWGHKMARVSARQAQARNARSLPPDRLPHPIRAPALASGGSARPGQPDWRPHGLQPPACSPNGNPPTSAPCSGSQGRQNRSCGVAGHRIRSHVVRAWGQHSAGVRRTLVELCPRRCADGGSLERKCGSWLRRPVDVGHTGGGGSVVIVGAGCVYCAGSPGVRSVGSERAALGGLAGLFGLRHRSTRSERRTLRGYRGRMDGSSRLRLC